MIIDITKMEMVIGYIWWCDDGDESYSIRNCYYKPIKRSIESKCGFSHYFRVFSDGRLDNSMFPEFVKKEVKMIDFKSHLLIYYRGNPDEILICNPSSDGGFIRYNHSFEILDIDVRTTKHMKPIYDFEEIINDLPKYSRDAIFYLESDLLINYDHS